MPRRPVLLLVCAFACLRLLAQGPPPSTIAAPIRVDLAPLMELAERVTPKVPPGVETWINLPGTRLGNPAYRFNLYRDPLYFSLNGRRLSMHTTVNYWMEVGLRMKDWVKGMGSCGLPPASFRRARLGLIAEVGVNRDWGLDLKLTADEPLKFDNCTVGALDYDITDKVLAGMKDALAKAAVDMETRVKASTLLRQRVEAAWLQAQQPVELRPDLHLLLNPEGVRLAAWTSQGKELILTPEIQVRPALVLGPCPALTPRPLPQLDLTEAPAQPGFHLRVEADLALATASRQMEEQLVGRRFDTPKGTFEITAASLRAQGPQVVLSLGLRGRVNGTVTLIGRPTFDTLTGQLRLADLDYTLESRSWITQFGEWLYRSDLRKTLADKCGWFLDDAFRNLRAQAQLGLNRTLSPELAMAGSVDDLRLESVEVLPDRFRVVANLTGQISMSLKTAL